MTAANPESHPCPICGYELDVDPWKDNIPTYDICPCCGIEFGYEDFRPTSEERIPRHAELRQKWIDDGMPWWSKSNPPSVPWDPREQLKRIGVSI